MKERRAGKFTEKLSMFMAVVSAVGGLYVLLDPVFTFTFKDQMIEIGGKGFSADLKGAVVSLILIGGWTAIKEYWLGASASGQQQGESMSRIAEASAPTAAAAVAAAASAPAGASPIKAETVNVEATTATLTEVPTDTTKGPTP